MGGIVVGVKNTTAKLVERICADFNFGVLLKIDKSMFTTGRDVIFACVYIPPERSPVYENNNISVLECLENCFTTQDLQNCDIIIGGDLNARTGNLAEYTVSENTIPELEEYSDILDGDIGIPRKSQDPIVNKWA